MPQIGPSPNRVKLTQDRVRKLQPADGKAALYWDTETAGFGVRVNPSGRVSFIVQYRVRGARGARRQERQEVLGTFPSVSVAEARERAHRAKNKASDGVDPVDERRAKQAAEEARRQAEEEERAAREFTLARLVDLFGSKYLDRENRASSAHEARRLLKRWVEALGDRPVHEIRKADILEFLAGKPGRVEANNLLNIARRMFRWATQWDLVEADPTAGVPKPQKNLKSRDRVLDDEEIIRFWTACDRVGWPSGRIFQLLLLTGCRENEIARMTWSELDLKNRTLNLPAARTKNGHAHTVHLSNLAMEIIEALPQVNRSKFVLTANGRAPLVNFDHAKKRVHRLMGDDVPNWRPHDLRRTATTILQRLGVPLQVTEKILNHVSGSISGVAATYHRHSYAEECRSALDALSRHVESLIRPTPDNVVHLRA